MPKRSWTVSVPPTALGGVPCDRQRVAFDDQVELARHLAAQCVAHRSADHVHAAFTRHGGEHDVGSRRGAQWVHAVMFH